MSQVYNSIFTGNQIDNALSVIIDSSVTVGQLQTLVGAVPGSAVAGKAMVMDNSRNYVNINSLTATILKASYLDLIDGSSDPAATPETGRKFLYFKNGSLWVKSDDGTTKQLKSGGEVVTAFSSQTQVLVTHNFGNRYPNVIVSIGNKDAKAEIDYTSLNTLTVSFNTVQTGTIICRIV